MKIEMRTIGPFQANAFVVMCEATSEAAIIDTGDSAEGLVEAAEEIGAKVTRILLTHGHIDHVGGAAKLHRAYPKAPLFLHPKGKPLADSVQRQGIMFGLQVEPVPPIDEALAGGQTIEIGTTIRLHVIETPGHSPGSVTFYEPHEGIAFVGDTLFQGSIGRTDLPGGDAATLLATLREVLLGLPDETRCYPGHGPSTTIARERRENPFLQPQAERLFGLA